MLSWLSKIDPNTALLALSLLSSVGGWIYHQIRGQKQQSVSDLVTGLARQIVSAGIVTPDAVETDVWAGLAKFDITKDKAGPLVAQLVHAAVQNAIADLMTQLTVAKAAAPVAGAVSYGDLLKGKAPAP